MQMLLHGLTPGVQDHRKSNFAAKILLPELLQELCGSLDEQVKQYISIEVHQQIEHMVNGKDDVEIMDGQDPFFLVFEPLSLLERPTLGTVAILSSLIVKIPILANCTHLHDTAHCRCAAT
jgi:hypothetical protein